MSCQRSSQKSNCWRSHLAWTVGDVAPTYKTNYAPKPLGRGDTPDGPCPNNLHPSGFKLETSEHAPTRVGRGDVPDGPCKRNLQTSGFKLKTPMPHHTTP